MIHIIVKDDEMLCGVKGPFGVGDGGRLIGYFWPKVDCVACLDAFEKTFGAQPPERWTHDQWCLWVRMINSLDPECNRAWDWQHMAELWQREYASKEIWEMAEDDQSIKRVS